jgi:hypothetical protein
MIKQLFLIPISAVLCLAAQAAVPQKTIDNLNAAYRGESNANHRYTLFAQKAVATIGIEGRWVAIIV